MKKRRAESDGFERRRGEEARAGFFFLLQLQDLVFSFFIFIDINLIFNLFIFLYRLL